MPQAADLGTKRLISLKPGEWVQWVTGRSDVLAEEVLSPEYQWVGRADDVAIRAYSPSAGRFVTLIEMQSRPQGTMPWRMFGYSGLSAEKTHLPVYPVVIHLLPPENRTEIPTIPSAWGCGDTRTTG